MKLTAKEKIEINQFYVERIFTILFLKVSEFTTSIKLIWLKSNLKTAKMPKNAFFAKSSGSQWDG